MTMEGGGCWGGGGGGDRGGGGDLFICFSSRRSVRSPSLSSSLSRRLRNSGSVKGGQSPAMFPSVGGGGGGSRKKGSGFEAVEPSSPKVTCIGQVRVKTSMRRKKKAAAAAAAALRSRSKRVGSGGEMSFRRSMEQRGEEERECFPSRNQSWVHLPLGGICDALKAFGSEFNCFSPCSGGGGCRRSRCFSSCCCSREKRKRTRRVNVGSCCNGFAKCLMLIEESGEEEERRRREEVFGVGMVVEDMGGGRRVRREMRELELVADELQKGLGLQRRGEEELPVSVPPKNALLLMRCRSDPVRVSALENRFFSSNVSRVEVEDDEEEPEEVVVEEVKDSTAVSVSERSGKGEKDELGRDPTEGNEEKEENPSMVDNGKEEMHGKDSILPHEEGKKQNFGNGPVQKEVEEKEKGVDKVLSMVVDVEEEKENKDLQLAKPEEKKKARRPITEERRRSTSSREKEGGRRHSFSVEKEVRRSTSYREGGGEGRRSSFSSESYAATRRSSFSTEKEARRRWSFSSEKEARRPQEEVEKSKAVAAPGKVEEGEKGNELPDCLLLMMYEPKLSMEVSKETWVCTADFLRWQPHRRRAQQQQQRHEKAKEEVAVVAGQEEEVKGQECQSQNKNKETVATTSIDNITVPPAPPPPPPVAAMAAVAPEIVKTEEQKPESANAATGAATATYGPFALTRCKSEPVRSSGKMSPDECFWKSRHHRPISAAGIGF